MHVFKCTMNYFAEMRMLLQGKKTFKVQIGLLFIMKWQVNHLIWSVGKVVLLQLMNCPPKEKATTRLSC